MSYQCQNCKAPLIIDDSLTDLSNSQKRLLLTKPHSSSPQAEPKSIDFIPQDRYDIYKKAVKANEGTPPRHSDFTALNKDENGHGSFVYVDAKTQEDDSQAQGDNEEQLPDFSKVKTLNQIFQILSTNLSISHPICQDCASLLAESYKLKFDEVLIERDLYMAFLKKLQKRQAEFTANVSDVDERLQDASSQHRGLQDQTAAKLKELQALEETHESLLHQLEEIEAETSLISDSELKEVLLLRNKLQLELEQKQDELDQMKELHQTQLDRLDNLRSLNIYTKMFNILFEELFGRINGFRLGYRVPCPEINVALGQVLFLLSFLAKTLKVEITPYKMVSLGSKSYLVTQSAETSSDGKTHTLPLYSTNEFTLGKLLNFNKLDVSMIALLDIISQFEAAIATEDPELELPYKISAKHDRIGTKSIRVTLNSAWTSACKMMLVDLNWLLTYTSSRA